MLMGDDYTEQQGSPSILYELGGFDVEYLSLVLWRRLLDFKFHRLSREFGGYLYSQNFIDFVISKVNPSFYISQASIVSTWLVSILI